MDSKDWEVLTRDIKEHDCILVIGTEFPIEIERETGMEITTFSDELKRLLINDLDSPKPPYNNALGVQLSELATYYTKLKSRNSLEIVILDWYSTQKSKISSPLFENLAALPFTFIIDTSCFNFFQQILAKKRKPQSGFYHFRGQQLNTVTTPVSDNSIGSPAEPYIYNLWGSVSDTSSIVLTDLELIEFMAKIISKNPGLPNNIRSELQKSEKAFLFLGVGIIQESWYYKTLLYILEFKKRLKKSFAVEFIYPINFSREPAIMFFNDNFNLLIETNTLTTQQNFVEKLLQAYGPVPEAPDTSQSRATSRPLVFISYTNEDYPRVKAIADKLQENNIDYWMGNGNLKVETDGNMEQIIKEKVNAFLLFQSAAMGNMPDAYLKKEIRIAEKRAQHFKKADDFLFPCYLDDMDSYRCLFEGFEPYRLPNNFYRLIDDILRSYERNKRRRIKLK
jgi:TIR domain/SIR2-like domain